MSEKLVQFSEVLSKSWKVDQRTWNLLIQPSKVDQQKCQESRILIVWSLNLFLIWSRCSIWLKSLGIETMETNWTKCQLRHSRYCDPLSAADRWSNHKMHQWKKAVLAIIKYFRLKCCDYRDRGCRCLKNMFYLVDEIMTLDWDNGFWGGRLMYFATNTLLLWVSPVPVLHEQYNSIMIPSSSF